MISILLPTRNRPENIVRLRNSIISTAANPEDIEMVIAIDDDDPTYDKLKFTGHPRVSRRKYPRMVLSEYWNRCYQRAKGDILLHCGDDIIFQTKDWDTTVKSTFADYPDHIVFVYGNDGSPGGKDFGTHGFIHRKWAETVGYFVPPYFSSDYNDTWLNDVAHKIGRHRYIDILTEHMHPDLHKGPFDITHQERKERHNRDRVGDIYGQKDNERQADAEKLKKVMA